MELTKKDIAYWLEKANYSEQALAPVRVQPTDLRYLIGVIMQLYKWEASESVCPECNGDRDSDCFKCGHTGMRIVVRCKDDD